MKRLLLTALASLLATAPAWADCVLRQSTSVDEGIGPFVDSTDGFTPETALTLTQPDVRLKKNGGNWAQKAAAQTLSHEENGWYEVTLDATDTNTVGLLEVAIYETGALPVWKECLVVETAVYDAFYADAITAIGVNVASVASAAIDNADFATAPGAAGGLMISGANSGTTTLGALTVTGATTLTGNVSMAAGLNITQSSANTAALVVTGNGTGNGATITSGNGATGNGASFVAASTNGSGLGATGAGTGSGVSGTGGTSGHGFSGTGGATTGDGMRMASSNGGAGARFLGQGTGDGILAASGGGATGNGATFNSLATNGNGIGTLAAGTGVGIQGIMEGSFSSAAGSFRALGIVDQGTAQGATATTLQLRAAAAFADSELNGNEILITSATTGAGQTRLITGYVGATDTATVANWTTTPTGTITYEIMSATATGGSVSIGVGGISANSFASGAIDAAAIATDAIGANEVADNSIDAGAIAANALTDAEFNSAAGVFYALGIIDQGTAQAATATTLQLRAAASFANDEIIGATCLVTGGSTGVGQSRTITDYDNATDTATVDAWTTTPTGTVTYRCFGTAPGGAGSSLTQADVRTALGVATPNLDTQLAAIDDYVDTEVAAILGQTGTTGVQIPNGEIVAATFGAGAIDATAIAADAIGASELAADAIGASELAANAIGAAEVADATIDAATFAAGAVDATAIAADAIGASELAADAIGTAELATNSISSDELATTAVTELVDAANTSHQILTGTCDSGTVTTCVDDALTQAATAQLDDRLICFNDSWCALITDFTPASDTVTTTKSAPSTRSAKVYTIFPSTLQ